jgi:ferritin-like metal-binding protein YciE
MSSETRNLDFKRRIHYEANKYLDILTIMQQLERNGFIDRFYELLSSVYESEHNFTISELRKVAKKAKENKEVFDFMDHYSSNTSIFKQNLASILEMFVETIWNAKFQKVYQTIQESSPEDFEGIMK